MKVFIIIVCKERTYFKFLSSVGSLVMIPIDDWSTDLYKHSLFYLIFSMGAAAPFILILATHTFCQNSVLSANVEVRIPYRYLCDEWGEPYFYLDDAVFFFFF